MRVLVTGGAGFIGSHLVDRFLSEGYKVRVLDSLEPKVHPRGLPSYVPKEVEFIHGSVTDRNVLRAALRDVDVVSHQAAYQDYMPDFSKFLHVNAVGTALLFELIVEHRLPVKKVIVASSQAVYGEGQYTCAEHGTFLPTPRSLEQLRHGKWEVSCPQCDSDCKPCLLREEFSNPYNQYAVSKIAEEKAALGLGYLNGIPTVALRYSITQGTRQSLYNHYSGVCRIFFSRALRGESLIIYEDGKQTRDFVHVSDVVDANMLVLTNCSADYHAFNVGSGVAVTVLEYAKAVNARVPAAVPLDITGQYRRGDNRNSVSSIDQLKGLGWKPKHDLNDILDEFLKWILQNGGVPSDIPDAHATMRGAGVVLTASSAEAGR
jgi:dTDP-L-rhamnose 4-epimerase